MTGNDGDTTEFGVTVKAARLLRGLSQSELAELAQINASYVSQIETGSRGRAPGREIVVKLAQALHANIDDWLEMTGHRPDPRAALYPRGRPTFRQFVETDPRLTKEQKNTLLSLYATWTGDTGR